MYPGYILLWWPWVYIAGGYLYLFTLCTLDTHCYDDPGYTLLVLINITIIPYVPLCTQDSNCYNDAGYTLLVLINITIIPYVLWIHIVMMSLGIHCWCLSISLLFLMYPGYTLLWWPWIYIAGAYQYHYYTLCTLDTHCYDAYLYHYTLCTLDTHCYDDPGYTLLVLNFITTIPYVPWIHIVMLTLGRHCWYLSISLV